MSSSDRLYDIKRFFDAAQRGQLNDVIKLSSIYCNDVQVLSQALIWSCRRGHLDVVKWLGEHTKAEVNYGTWDSPLSAACYYDHVDIVKYLVETCHADVNLPDRPGYTPLSVACHYVRMSVSMYLLCEVCDLDVNIARYNGNTALHYAVWCNKEFNTQLHEACGDRYGFCNRSYCGNTNRGGYVGNANEVLRLVSEKSDMINGQDNEGNTPLHRACSSGQSDIVETLMLAGADETITNDAGKTPAQVAVREGHSELLELLDRDSLWQVMLRRRKKSKLSRVILMLLVLKLMKQKRMTKHGDIYIDCCPRCVDN